MSVSINNDLFTATKRTMMANHHLTGKMETAKAEPKSITIRLRMAQRSIIHQGRSREDRAEVEKMTSVLKGNNFPIGTATTNAFFHQGQFDKQLGISSRLRERDEADRRRQSGFEKMERDLNVSASNSRKSAASRKVKTSNPALFFAVSPCPQALQ